MPVSSESPQARSEIVELRRAAARDAQRRHHRRALVGLRVGVDEDERARHRRTN